MAVVASAPGKVLMTGGYLVLEKSNAGLVLSTNARFYAIVKPINEEVKPESWAWKWTDVKLTSPQLSRESMYKLSLNHLTLQSVDSRNPFVEHAIQYAIAAAHLATEKDKEALHKLLLQGNLQIELAGLPLTPESLGTLAPFASITFNATESNGVNSKPEVAKTGLGSSAAMTTAVVAAMLHYLGVVDLSNPCKEGKFGCSDLDVIHMIAQTSHCLAQGKVGSGFDVSCAVYGSQRYVRFSPEVLSFAQVAVTGLPLNEVIGTILKGKWDNERTEFSLPPLMNLFLGEPGSGGSSTPSMVGAVKKWQMSDPEKARENWQKLSDANLELETKLNVLSKLAKDHWDVYLGVIKSCSVLTSEKWVLHATEPINEAIIKELLEAREAMLRIKILMRQMGEAASVPIEPESQTQLLDSTMNAEGVLLAGVPGAGGFDAIFAITLGDSGSKLTQAWSSHNVLALLVRENPHGVCLESGDPRTTCITSGVSSIHLE
ncbi:Phosphomevalonate kinase, peroxisomal [Arabidopsis thaliana]